MRHNGHNETPQLAGASVSRQPTRAHEEWPGADPTTDDIRVHRWVAVRDPWVTADGYRIPAGGMYQVESIDAERQTVTLCDTMRRRVGTIAIAKVRAA